MIALLLGACSSSGDNAKQPDDEFLDRVEATCRDASREIRKLTSGADDATSDLRDIISDTADSLNGLAPPTDLSKDWDEYTAKMDQQVAALGKVVDAIDAGDVSTEQTSLADLNQIGNDADLLVNAVGAIRCRGIVPVNALTPDDLGALTTDVITPPTEVATTTTDSVPASSTPATEVETSPPNTPLAIDTIPVTQATTPDTSGTSGGVISSDVTLAFQPNAGYTWGTLEDIPGSVTPTDDPVLGPLLSAYYVGVMENATDGSTVFVYLTVLNQDTEWTPEQLSAYYEFELVGDGGVDQITPANGLLARFKAGAVEGYDGAVFTIPGFGISLLGPVGADMLGLLDGFAVANSLGA